MRPHSLLRSTHLSYSDKVIGDLSLNWHVFHFLLPNNNGTFNNSQFSLFRYFAFVKSDGFNVLTTSTLSMRRIDDAAFCVLHCHVCVDLLSFSWIEKKFLCQCFSLSDVVDPDASERSAAVADVLTLRRLCCYRKMNTTKMAVKFDYNQSIYSTLRKKKLHMYTLYVCCFFSQLTLRKPESPD